MASDLCDILDIERPTTPDVTRDSFLSTKKRNFERIKVTKRPEGMHREVFALLYNDNKDAPPLLPTDASLGVGSGYIQTKARLGMKKVRKWEWAPFTNPARTDGAVFHHWRRSDNVKEYPFAKFNKQLLIPQYTLVEYNMHLQTSPQKWSKEQTDHLFDLARRFDLRFVVMHDRWDRNLHGTKTVEDLKERYYEVVAILTKLRSGPGQEKKVFTFDADHERRRKEQLKKLFERTSQQVREEQMLIGELRKIEARKKERERKTQDLQKLISQAGQQSEIHAVVPTTSSSSANAGGPSTSANTQSTRKSEKKLHRKKTAHNQRPSKLESVVNSIDVAGISGIKFADIRSSGVYLRSQKMKLPANIGQRKLKALEQAMQEFKVDPSPPPTEEICNAFNELRSDLVLLCELRSALSTCMFEIESLKHQYEATYPGKTLTIPPQLLAGMPIKSEEASTSSSAAATASSSSSSVLQSSTASISSSSTINTTTTTITTPTTTVVTTASTTHTSIGTLKIKEEPREEITADTVKSATGTITVTTI